MNIYRSRVGFAEVPIFRGTAVQAENPARTIVRNIDLRTTAVGFDTAEVDHFNIADTPGVQEMVLREIGKTCLRARQL